MAARTLSPKVQRILRDLKAGLVDLYGSRLDQVILYGSYARGEDRPGSDVDVLAILDDYEDYWTEVKRTSHLVAELSLKNGVTVALHLMRRSDWERRQEPLVLNIQEEGIAA